MKKSYLIIPFIPQTILRIVSKILVLIFLRPKIKGLENLEKLNGRFILASNHINEFDPVILLSAFPFKSFFRPVFFVSLSKKYYLKRGLRARLLYGGKLFKILGAEPVYLGVKDFSFSLQNHTKVLENNAVTYIFPEGRVNVDGEVREAKGGTAFLAQETKTNILPVYMTGTEEGSFWKDLFSFKRKMKIVIGPSIKYPEGKDIVGLKSFAQDVLENIRDLGKNL